MKQEHFFQAETTKPFDQVMSDLEKSVVNNGFSVLSVIDLHKKYLSLGKPSKPISIVHLCNPEMSYHAISLNKKMVCMMPKAINVFVDDDDKVKVVFMRANPENLEEAFPDINISELSKKVGKILQKIVEETVA